MCMTFVMLFNIKSKYTAVGRKELTLFFYLYFLDTVLEMLLVSNILPFGTVTYKVNNFGIKIFSSVQVAAISGTFCSLMLNGFIGFQRAEDGSRYSIWVIYSMHH
jgi:hypothetical protein